jgi:hypothetical protein
MSNQLWRSRQVPGADEKPPKGAIESRTHWARGAFTPLDRADAFSRCNSPVPVGRHRVTVFTGDRPFAAIRRFR